MSTDHLIADIPQKALIKFEGKVLIVKDTGNGQWELPGGRLSINEKPHDGLKRELMEELGIDVEVSQAYDTFVFTSKTGINHFVTIYLCQLKSNLSDIKISDSENTEIMWIGRTDMVGLSMRDEYKEVLKKFFDSKS